MRREESRWEEWEEEGGMYLLVGYDVGGAEQSAAVQQSAEGRGTSV
jgi:hypothetical protein